MKIQKTDHDILADKETISESEYDILSDNEIKDNNSQSSEHISLDEEIHSQHTTREYYENIEVKNNQSTQTKFETNNISPSKEMHYQHTCNIREYINIHDQGFSIILPNFTFTSHGFKLSKSGLFYNNNNDTVNFGMNVGNCNTQIFYNKETKQTEIIQKEIPTIQKFGHDQYGNILPGFRLNRFGIVEKIPSLFDKILNNSANILNIIWRQINIPFDNFVEPGTAFLWGVGFTSFYILTSGKFQFCDKHLFCELKTISYLCLKGGVYCGYYPITLPLSLFSPNSFHNWLIK